VEDCSFDHTNSAPWISFVASPEEIIVESNQDGFTENDVRQICHTGRSEKRQQRGYIGEKGIGFKAIFQVASKVHIQSNAFSFYFKYRRDGTSEERLGMIHPLPANDPIPEQERPLTRMTLTPNDTNYANVVSYFNEIHPTLLLFLSKIQKISITVHNPPAESTVTTFSRKVPDRDTSANLTCIFNSVEIQGVVLEPQTSRYYVFRHTVTGLSEVIRRPDRDRCELVLAFQVDEKDFPVTPIGYDVFAYLPVGIFGFNVSGASRKLCCVNTVSF
jgi:hypothetical protein